MVPLIMSLSRGQKESHNEVIMTALQGQVSGPMKGLGNL